MIEAVIQFFVTAIVIFVAGTALTRFADSIADITKLGRLLIGTFLLAAATSLPELMVDIAAVRRNMPNLAVGDLMGSSLFNLLIIAILDLVYRSKSKIFSTASTAHALSAVFSISLTAIAALAILLSQYFVKFEIGSLGLGSVALLLTYLLGIRIIFYDQKISLQKTTGVSNIEASDRKKAPKAIFGFAASAVVILIAAPYLAEAAGKIADLSNLGRTFIGTSLVAFSTSLPELVTTREAIKRGAYDLAIGNIFGSNAFNMVILVVLDFIYTGSFMGSVSQTHAYTAIAVIFVSSIAIISLLYRAEKRKILIEPSALLIILLVIASLSLVYFMR